MTDGERPLHRTAFAEAHWSVSSLFVIDSSFLILVSSFPPQAGTLQITGQAFALDLADEGGGGAEGAADGGAGGIGPDDGFSMEEGGGVEGFMGVCEGGMPFAIDAGGAWHGPAEEGVKPRPLAGQG